MVIEGVSFSFVQNIEPFRDSEGKVAKYAPQSRYKSAGSQPLNPYGDGAFCKFRVATTAGEGVYAFVVGGKVVYVGKCDRLADRVNNGYGNITPKNCYEDGQRTNCRVNKLVLECVERGEQVGLWFTAASAPLDVEARLLRALNPPWNLAGVRRERGNLGPPPMKAALGMPSAPPPLAGPGRGTVLGRYGRERDRSTVDKPVGLVWQIADEMYARNPSVSRGAVVNECVRRGVALNTARTQYSLWRLLRKHG